MFVVENFVVGKKEREIEIKEMREIFFHTRMILNERRDREVVFFCPWWLSNNIIVFEK